MTKHDIASLNVWDAVFAVFAHALIVVSIILLAWWQPKNSTDKAVLKHIDVRMISAKELQKMQHKTPVKPKPPVIQPKVTPPPLVHINPKLVPPFNPAMMLHPKNMQRKDLILQP